MWKKGPRLTKGQKSRERIKEENIVMNEYLKELGRKHIFKTYYLKKKNLKQHIGIRGRLMDRLRAEGLKI